jgi:hypothetical protein
VLTHPLHGSADQVSGLPGSRRHVGMYPGAILPDVGHLQEVGIQAYSLQRAPEGPFVHPWRAGSDDHPVHSQFADVVADRTLTGVGAGVLVGANHEHVL